MGWSVSTYLGLEKKSVYGLVALTLNDHNPFNVSDLQVTYTKVTLRIKPDV